MSDSDSHCRAALHDCLQQRGILHTVDWLKGREGGRESTQTRLKEGHLGFEEDFVHNTDSSIKSNVVLSLCVLGRSCKILCSRVQLRRCKDGKLLQVQSLQNFWSRQLQVVAGHSLEKSTFFGDAHPACQPALTAVAAGAKSAKILTMLQGPALC